MFVSRCGVFADEVDIDDSNVLGTTSVPFPTPRAWSLPAGTSIEVRPKSRLRVPSALPPLACVQDEVFWVARARHNER